MAEVSSNVSGNNLDVDAEADSLDAKFVENLRIEEETSGNNVANGESSIMQGEDKVHVISSGGTNNTGSMSRNDSYELRQDVMSEKRKRLDNNKDLSVSTSTIQKDKKCSKALAFSIPIDTTCLPSRQPPKRLCNAKKTGKASIEILNKKQALAEERRQRYKENRLKRMHERQEACRKLAQNVETLLQQRALVQGTANGGVKHMPASELLVTARLVSQNFRALTNQLGNDLTVKDGGREKMCKECQGENQNARVPCVQKKFPSSVSFTVQCDSGKSPVKPKLATKQQQVNKRTLTAGDIEEKLRKAEERRNKRKELRSQRARENREALLAMALDLEKFKELQSATTSTSQDNCENLAEQNKEAAILAERLADQFDRLNKRYSDDLRRAENFQVVHPSVHHWIPKGFME